jgi:Ca2+-transporting ATPase
VSKEQVEQTEPKAWHALPARSVMAQLQTDFLRGLSAGEAQERLQVHGPNEVAEERRRSPISLLLAQIRDFMILVLLGAAILSGVIGEPQDTIAILVIVLLNAIFGAVQEYRAERAVAALRAIAAPTALVLRDGRRLSIDGSEVVPGDVIELQAGDIVPADLRLLEAADLLIDESALTGESQGADKSSDQMATPDVPVSDRVNLAFKSSLVSRGRGLGVVVATGMNTEIGHIAELLRGETGVKTPLQRRLARFGRRLALATLAICTVVFVAGLMQGQPPMLMFLTAVSLAVAAIPEALPAVVTVSLALGARTLSRHNAVVRRLPAVEALGSVTTICSDKTGTLTENRMSAEVLVVAGQRRRDLPHAGEGSHAWQRLAAAMALNNDVVEREGGLSGDPTEVALYEAAQRAGQRKKLEQQWQRVAEVPFESERQSMATLHEHDGAIEVFVKGAPEQVLDHCMDAMGPEGPAALDREQALADAEDLASNGYRVLAFAWRRLPEVPQTVSPQTVERELTLLGLVALIDPPRPEAPQAVAECLGAGITPIMITGDHPGTARAIARTLGIVDDGGDVLTGRELTQLSDDRLAEVAQTARVYARVSPEQKTRIVKALQANGELVAMTGDGVNDAPALKRAGIGVAMGMRGTDVAREASGMVLLDDDFATIVHAVRIGRRIFDNIRKFITYTMSSNSGEIWTLFLAPFLGLPIPLLPIHILWINLVTDGLPGLAFTAEPAEPGIMRRPPRPPQEGIFSRGMWQRILWVGLFVAGVSIASQAWALGRGEDHWQTVVFSVLTFSQLFYSMAVRSERNSLFRIGWTTNPALLGAILLTVALQLAVIYTPALQPIFRTQALPLQDLGVVLGLSSLVLFAVEIEKWLARRGWVYKMDESNERDRSARSGRTEKAG